MTNCKKLWDIWFLTYLIVINLYLTYNAILNYMNFKFNSMDPLYGANWGTGLTYLILECIIIPLALLPIILYMNIVPIGNFANDGRSLGKDEEFFHFVLNDTGKANIVLNSKEKSCCKQNFLRLLKMELPPISYVLQVVAAYCYLIPKPFIDARQIFHKVLKPNQIWHTDLDILFDPDSQHPEFSYFKEWSYIQPMTVAYFNFGFSLFLLSIQYSRVFWNVSRAFTLILSFIMLTFSIHVLIEYCSLSVMIKIAENPNIVSPSMRLELNVFTIVFLSILANIILLFSFTTVFHYGILQYGDIMVHRNRRIRRQMLNSSPHIIGSNQLDMAGTFSPCASENNYSESSIEPVFSKSHLSHIFAICSIAVSVIIKSPVIVSSYKHLYSSTADTVTLINMLISIFYLVSWLILWFAFALRRTWNFKIKSNVKLNADQILMNGNTLLNNNGHMQLHQMQNSFMLNPKTSELNLSKQEIMTANRSTALDGCSDETDMSSKLSSNNYVYLQSMRNGTMGFDINNHGSMLRNPMYLSYSMNNPNTHNPNVIYANDDSLNIRSTHLEDQLGSEHSYNSNRSRNLGFEILPPILPNFDENRYKHFNSNSAAMDKLIPRYLRNPSFDFNGSVQLSMPNNDLLNHTPTTTTMTYTLDNNFQNYNNRYKQTNLSSGQLRSPEKYSSLHGNVKTGSEQIDFLTGISEDDLQRRAFLNGETNGRYSSDSTKRLPKSPLFPTLVENAGDCYQTEQESLQSKFDDGMIDHMNILNMASNPSSSTDVKNGSNISNNINNNNNNNNNNDNDNNNQSNDRMCSQV